MCARWWVSMLLNMYPDGGALYFTQWFHRPGVPPPPISPSFPKDLRMHNNRSHKITTANTICVNFTFVLLRKPQQQEARLANHIVSICRTLHIQRSVILLRERRLAKQKRADFGYFSIRRQPAYCSGWMHWLPRERFHEKFLVRLQHVTV